ncbi:MAG: hypothetical protein AB1626_05585, partial [Candidatus Micrarchaeota archaeon]
YADAIQYVDCPAPAKVDVHASCTNYLWFGSGGEMSRFFFGGCALAETPYALYPEIGAPCVITGFSVPIGNCEPYNATVLEEATN